ncbi:hypothetical protein LAD71_00005, partial [Mycoplasma sp. 2946H]|nr:hypothetical protein [Mycoplasma tauri]
FSSLCFSFKVWEESLELFSSLCFSFKVWEESLELFSSLCFSFKVWEESLELFSSLCFSLRWSDLLLEHATIVKGKNNENDSSIFFIKSLFLFLFFISKNL